MSGIRGINMRWPVTQPIKISASITFRCGAVTLRRVALQNFEELRFSNIVIGTPTFNFFLKDGSP